MEGGHGARHDLASTPIDVLTDFYNNLKSTRMNSLDPFKAITFSIGSVNGVSNHNVIPDSLNFKGTFRYLHHHPKFEIDEDVLKLGVAAAVQNVFDILKSDEEIIFKAESMGVVSLAKAGGSGYFQRRSQVMEIHGKNGVAKAFIETIEENTAEQITKMLDSDITRDTKVRIMPDVHYGKGSTIGTTIRLTEAESEWKVSPNVVGVDIGCGMMSYKLADFNMPLDEFDRLIVRAVPSGKGVHEKSDADLTERTKNLSIPLSDKEKDYINRSLGTLGGGNHFIELATDEEGAHWLTVHSGSRKLGHMIATYHQKIANFTLNQPDNEELLKSLRDKGHYEEIHKLLNPGKKKQKQADDLAYLEGDLLADYINDMAIAQQFAHDNRKTMLEAIIGAANLTPVDSFDSVHNFIDIGNGIIRKGATSAQEGERLIIPLNMRDGSLVCVGKGNPDWNFSAPHGAGRVMSRTQANKTIDVKKFMASMKGVYSSSVGTKTVDESPFVYKAAEDIISRIDDTVEIQHWIKPVYNFKAK